VSEEPIDAVRFRAVIGHFPTGVAVVTSHGREGSAGLTTNAVTSVSLDPVLILVCFDNDSRTLPVVRDSGRFAVNVLRAGQEELALVFASKRLASEKFEAVSHRVVNGMPLLDDVLAWLTCDLEALHPAGDHTIGVGRVTSLDADDGGEPLVFFRGRFAGLAVESGRESGRRASDSPGQT
jgi:3-hydroxy-9,10-secoandrosta-1,3,5(10)-triene-9,17-dione monooxygenase reductase component